MKFISILAALAMAIGAASALATPAVGPGRIDVADLEKRSGGLSKSISFIAYILKGGWKEDIC